MAAHAGLSPSTSWSAKQAPIAKKPANISLEATAAVPIAAITALQAIRDHGQLEAGQKVLIDVE